MASDLSVPLNYYAAYAQVTFILFDSEIKNVILF